jgi:predicted nuclease with TOPRIM domain
LGTGGEIVNPHSAAADVKAQAEASIEHWQQRCAELTAERDQLRQELAELREKYEPVLDSLCILMGMDGEVDFEALRAQMGKGPSLEELLDELEAEYRAKGAL